MAAQALSYHTGWRYSPILYESIKIINYIYFNSEG